MATAALLLASYSLAQHPYTESQVIAFAKSIDVKTLDPSLPSQRLEDWLQNGPPHAQIRWTLADSCDLKPVDPKEDYPLCAKVWFLRNGQAGSFMVQVGQRSKGMSGRPQLYDGVGAWEDGPGWIMTGGVEKLSGLPGLLDQPAYAHGVGQLYNQVVAHHPLGIPSGRTMTTIQPLLSKRLTDQLQAARACEADYLRQHNQPQGSTAKPGWMNSGLFSGDGNRASPASAWPVREGQQKDGSFLVMVNLFAQTIDLGNGLKGGAYSPTGNWRVDVKVISEGGRFVVDDVHFFEGSSPDGPSHLLSESFAGCTGPRWTGMVAMNKEHSGEAAK